MAIGVPGCPDSAAWTASIDRVRMVLMQVASSGCLSDLIAGLGSTAVVIVGGSPSGVAGSGRRPGLGQGASDDLLGLLDDGVEVGPVLEALGVDLVQVLGARGPRGEPAVGADHLEATDRGVVARGAGELGDDRLAGQLGRVDR